MHPLCTLLRFLQEREIGASLCSHLWKGKSHIGHTTLQLKLCQVDSVDTNLSEQIFIQNLSNLFLRHTPSLLRAVSGTTIYFTLTLHTICYILNYMFYFALLYILSIRTLAIRRFNSILKETPVEQ